MKIADRFGLSGEITIEVRESGVLVAKQIVPNLITDTGVQTYLSRGAGVGALVAPTGMRLGTGNTAVAKFGAGAAIVTYQSGTAKAFTTATAAAQPGGAGTAWIATYVVAWTAGEVGTGTIAEIVITNEASITNVAGTTANTIARALIGPFVCAGATSITATWTNSLTSS